MTGSLWERKPKGFRSPRGLHRSRVLPHQRRCKNLSPVAAHQRRCETWLSLWESWRRQATERAVGLCGEVMAGRNPTAQLPSQSASLTAPPEGEPRHFIRLRQKSSCPSLRTSGGHEVRRDTFARQRAHPTNSAKRAFNPAPAGAFSLFHISLFQKEKYGRRRQGASTRRMRIRWESPLSQLR